MKNKYFYWWLNSLNVVFELDAKIVMDAFNVASFPNSELGYILQAYKDSFSNNSQNSKLECKWLMHFI